MPAHLVFATEMSACVLD